VSAIVAFLALACAGPRAPVATRCELLQEEQRHGLYCPEILANARRPGESPPATLTPGATATTTPTPTPRPLLSRTPGAGIPPEDMAMIVEAVRLGRRLEPGSAVHDDPLLAIAGNSMCGAQLQPIIELQGYRILETALCLVVETPLGEIWILRGFVWARHPLPWLTPTSTSS